MSYDRELWLAQSFLDVKKVSRMLEGGVKMTLSEEKINMRYTVFGVGGFSL